MRGWMQLALDNADAIAAVPGVNGLMLGAGDLRVALRCPPRGAGDPEDQKILDAMRRLCQFLLLSLTLPGSLHSLVAHGTVSPSAALNSWRGVEGAEQWAFIVATPQGKSSSSPASTYGSIG